MKQTDESSSGGWWVAGVVYIQVDVVSSQERRWGLVVTERGDTATNSY